MGEEDRNSGIPTTHVATAKCIPFTGTWSIDSATSYSFLITHVHHIENATTGRLAGKLTSSPPRSSYIFVTDRGGTMLCEI